MCLRRGFKINRRAAGISNRNTHSIKLSKTESLTVARVGAEWDGYLNEVERLHDAGEIVVVQIRYRGTYEATGRTMAAQGVHIWTVRDGKLAKLEQYLDTAGMRDVVAAPASSQTA